MNKKYIEVPEDYYKDFNFEIDIPDDFVAIKIWEETKELFNARSTNQILRTSSL